MNPAEHEARKDAERGATIVGSPEDRVEALVFADLQGDDESAGAWLHPGGSGAWLFGAVDPV